MNTAPMTPDLIPATWSDEQALRALKDPANGDAGLLTSFWGPAAWTFLHAMSVCFPQKPTDIDKERYRTFWNHLQYVLPCPSCRKHFAEHSQTPELALTDRDLVSREAFVGFVYRFHNEVSRSLGKKFALPLNQVIQRYEAFRAKCETPRPTGPVAQTYAAANFAANAAANPAASNNNNTPCTMALSDRQEAYRVLYALRHTPELFVVDVDPWMKDLLNPKRYSAWLALYEHPQGPWYAHFTAPRRPGPPTLASDPRAGQPLVTWTWADALRAAHVWAETTWKERSPCYTTIQDLRLKCPDAWQERELKAGWTLRQWRLHEGATESWEPWNERLQAPHPLELALLYWRCTTTCPWKARDYLRRFVRPLETR